MSRSTTLTRAGSAVLAGWSAVNGSITSPAAFATLTSVAVPAGLVTINWTVQLGGAAGAGDANNFKLFNNGTLLANSSNQGAPGTYPQQPVTAQIPPGGGQFLEVTAGAVNGTAGAVYTGQLPGGGGGIVQLGPTSPGELWYPTLVRVSCSAAVGIGTCQCIIYAGSGMSQSTFVDGTFSGDTGDASDAINGQVIHPGEYVYAAWTGGALGAIATAVVSGTRTVA